MGLGAPARETACGGVQRGRGSCGSVRANQPCRPLCGLRPGRGAGFLGRDPPVITEFWCHIAVMGGQESDTEATQDKALRVEDFGGTYWPEPACLLKPGPS